MPVYVIQAGDTPMVKIGWARDPEARCKELQTGHPLSFSIIRTIDAQSTAERWMHARFRANRIRGEWFQFDPDMLTVDPATDAIPAAVEPKRYHDALKPIRDLVESFLQTSGMTATGLGIAAVNDGKLVSRIRAGANLTVLTVDRVRAFIEARSMAAQVGQTESGTSELTHIPQSQNREQSQ